jgi:hypothetical protein
MEEEMRYGMLMNEGKHEMKGVSTTKCNGIKK